MLISMRPTRLGTDALRLMISLFNGRMSESVRLLETTMTRKAKSLSLVMTRDHTMKAHFGFGPSWNTAKVMINPR